MKYEEIFEESWEEFCQMTRAGEFSSHQEQDIVCMMHHLGLLKLETPALIHTYAKHNFDLILGSMKAAKRKDQKHTHCLLVENKFILKKRRKNKRLCFALKDIDKISKEGDSTVRRVFVIFDKSNSIGSEEIKDLEKYARTKKVALLNNLWHGLKL